jgi:hypothetical protein
MVGNKRREKREIGSHFINGRLMLGCDLHMCLDHMAQIQ